jgi:hypothetical protein
MEILNLDRLSLFIFFVIPGFISLKIWSMLVPSEEHKFGDYILEFVSYSCINLILFSWLINLISTSSFKLSNTFLYYLFLILILFVAPMIWPILFYKLSNSKIFMNLNFLHPIPTAWDWVFSREQTYYVLIHLKNGTFIGGLYGGNSFSSAFPQFLSKIENSKGLWLTKSEFDYIELFEPIINKGDDS